MFDEAAREEWWKWLQQKFFFVGCRRLYQCRHCFEFVDKRARGRHDRHGCVPPLGSQKVPSDLLDYWRWLHQNFGFPLSRHMYPWSKIR